MKSPARECHCREECREATGWPSSSASARALGEAGARGLEEGGRERVGEGEGAWLLPALVLKLALAWCLHLLLRCLLNSGEGCAGAKKDA